MTKRNPKRCVNPERPGRQFKYETGMFGTCANPLHLGHVRTIVKAANECRELYVVLSYSRRREKTDWRIRRQWLYETIRHLGNVKVIELEDKCKSKAEYDSDDHWREGAERVKAAVGKRIDAVYCGSDYDRPDNPYARLYPESKIVFVSRDILPVSSTEIRKDPLAHWAELPPRVRAAFVKKVLVIGAESTGKSTLVKSLAEYFNTECVMEYGRDVCERCGGEAYMTRADYDEIIRVHEDNIRKASEKADRVMFVDTDRLTTVWYMLQNGVGVDGIPCNGYGDRFDLVLFMEPDVAYVPDGLRVDARNEGKARKKTSEAIKEFYAEFGYRNVISVGGTYAERLETAVSLIRKEFKI